MKFKKLHTFILRLNAQNMDTTNITLNYLIIIGASFMSGLILFASSNNDIILHVLAHGFLAICACIVVKFDITHPYCWYSPFFFLYSCSYAILILLGYEFPFYIIYNHNSLIYSWIAFVIFLLVVTPRKCSKNLSHPSFVDPISIPANTMIKIIYVIFSIILLRATTEIFGLGATNKYGIYGYNNSLISIAINYIALYAILLCVFKFAKDSQKNGIPSIVTLLVYGAPVVYFGFTVGERDLYLRLILMVIIVLFGFGFIKNKHFIILIPLGIALIIFSTAYKYFMVVGTAKEMDLTLRGIVVSFLSADFYSAGANLNQIAVPKYDGIFSGMGLINELIISIRGTLYTTHSGWYNNLFFPGSRIGYGWTIVGSGYVNFGIPGIILVFSFLSLLIKELYKRMYLNIYMYLLYTTAIPAYIFSLRSDIGMLLRTLIRYTIPLLLLLFIFEKIKMRVKETDGIISAYKR